MCIQGVGRMLAMERRLSLFAGANKWKLRREIIPQYVLILSGLERSDLSRIKLQL